MQRCGKYASSTIEAVFSACSCRGVILKTTGAAVLLREQLWSVNQRARHAAYREGNEKLF
jgi:hypothetical protein